MDIRSWSKKITEFIKKYKYAVLVLFIGLGLMVLPEKEKYTETESIQTEMNKEATLNEQLAEILSKIEGAGTVKVLLATRTGEETLYQTNEDVTYSDSSNSTKITTVMVTTSNRDEMGLIRQINPPQYLGAVIVCQGGDSPTVRLAIVDAVSKVTGLSSDHISVLKMK